MSECQGRGKETYSFVHHSGRIASTNDAVVSEGLNRTHAIRTFQAQFHHHLAMSPIESCLENGINLLIFKPHGGQGCAEMLEELGISILQLRRSDFGLSLCGHSKQVGSGKMSFLLYTWSFAERVYTRASLVQSKQIMIKCH